VDNEWVTAELNLLAGDKTQHRSLLHNESTEKGKCGTAEPTTQSVLLASLKTKNETVSTGACNAPSPKKRLGTQEQFK
jgi:hypothetical protein